MHRNLEPPAKARAEKKAAGAAAENLLKRRRLALQHRACVNQEKPGHARQISNGGALTLESIGKIRATYAKAIP